MIQTPLVTFICLLYNQERFVQQALESIFSQTYSNLQIVISDDCSTDNTYSIAKVVVKKYTGSADVLLRENISNQGLGEHFSNVLALAKGDYIFMAAGDDISQADRVENVMDFWQKKGNSCKAIFTNLKKIDDSDKEIGLMFSREPRFARNLKDFISGVSCWCVGASLAFHRSLYDKYGGFIKGVGQEDGCFAFRAILEGEIIYIDKPMVLYRFHDSNISQNLDVKRMIKFKMLEKYMFSNFLVDAKKANPNAWLLFKLNWMVLKSKAFSRLISFPIIGYGYFGLRKIARFLYLKIKG